MTDDLSYTIQIGTDFDLGQDLVWTLKSDPLLPSSNVSVPRPKRYRKTLPDLVQGSEAIAITNKDFVTMAGLDPDKLDKHQHIFLSLIDPMQRERYFCPAGDWFYGLGERLAKYRKVFAHAPVKFMMSLRNPAPLLSDAWTSGLYTGLDVVQPDPFELRWCDLLSDLRAHVPDTPFVVWPAEDSPFVWGQVLRAAIRPGVDVSVASELYVATQLMNEDGGARLRSYLEAHPSMPADLRARVITIFLKRFAHEDAVESDILFPGWTDALQDQMEKHYAADLDKVRTIDGVTLVSI
ncbi:MAG: hypothetical protein ABJ263_04460 [Tateyamaria sp.]|uniref:hypothetical protein n=1 Tax=Tateyamaria sp. TaxID=1929288 RepID=UPI0032764DFF